MNAYALKSAELTANIFDRLFRQIPQAQWDTPLEEGRFTPREVICHLADWEPIFCARIAAAIQADLAPMPDIDEGQIAIDHDYAHSNIPEQLKLFRERRARTVQMIRELTPEQLELRYDHSTRGPIKIADVANMLGHHDVYHIEQLSAYLEPKIVGTW
ncbi:MAG: DinB family protein [Armatimonadetes bacterium]|nr:DinB family protein [Armatimonadota bacterium]